jgi:hypothetical protein
MGRINWRTDKYLQLINDTYTSEVDGRNSHVDTLPVLIIIKTKFRSTIRRVSNHCTTKTWTIKGAEVNLSILSQFNPVQSLTYFFKINFNINLPCTPRCLISSYLNFLFVSHLPHAFYLSRRSHPTWVYHPNAIWCRSSGRAVWGAGLDRSYTESQVRIPLKAWMFVLVFLCCVVLCS